MTIGWRIAGSALVAAALSLTLTPGAAAEPKAPKDQPGLSIVCQAAGKPSGERPRLSKADADRWLFHRKADGRDPGVLWCKINTGWVGERIVRARAGDTPPSLVEFRGQTWVAR